MTDRDTEPMPSRSPHVGFTQGRHVCRKALWDQGCRMEDICPEGLAHADRETPVPTASSPQAEPTAGAGGAAHLLAEGEGVSVWLAWLEAPQIKQQQGELVILQDVLVIEGELQDILGTVVKGGN